MSKNQMLLAASLLAVSIPPGAEGITQIVDVIVPEIFTPTVQQITEEKSRLIASGGLAVDPLLSNALAGDGLTFNTPSFRDLENDEDNVSTDDQSDLITGGSSDAKPKKTSMTNEVSVRLSRNQSWQTSDLASDLAQGDPSQSIANRVGAYWARRLQAAFIATMNGIFAMNDAAPVGGSTHTQGDMTNDVSDDGTVPGNYEEGVTDFTAKAFLGATLTMGDSSEDLALVMVHSIVKNTMQNKNLIEFIPDARGEVMIPTYMGHTVIVDDNMPNDGLGKFETWIFGAGAVRLGQGSPKVPTETKRYPASGNGGGSESLFNRLEWCIHATGHAYVGAAAGGGPSNAATVNNLAAPTSWVRRYTERKQIKIARLVTREF